MTATTPVTRGGASSFNTRIMAGLVVAGLVGFIGYWLISAFAPEGDATGNGGGHAMSRSAVGFSGVIELARASGMHPRILRTTGSNGALTDTDTIDLLVLTPTPGTPPEDIVKAIGDFDGTVLVVLPKHQPIRDPLHRGWVRRGGEVSAVSSILPLNQWRIRQRPQAVTLGVDPDTLVDIDIYDDHVGRRAPPDPIRLLRPDGLYAVATLGDNLLLAGPPDEAFEHIVILSDPDFLNNRALATPEGATTAVAMLRALDGGGEGRVAFDVTLNGFGTADRNLLRLAMMPPFLGLTLCFVVAGLLALWQGFVRFGPPWREGRAVALGKGALVANGAQLIVQARRLANFAPRYTAMVRDVAARQLHAPSALVGAALDRWLDRFVDSKGQRFSQLADALDAAHAPDEIVRRAAALGQWRREIVRDGE